MQNPGSRGFVSINDNWPEIFRKGSNIGTLPTPDPTKTLSGGAVTYTFDGWYLDEACTKKATDADYQNLQTDKVFYGRYVPNAAQYTVEYYYDGVKGETLTLTGTVGTAMSFPTPTAEKEVSGRTYAYDRTENGGKRITAVPADNVIKIYYTARYTITYDWGTAHVPEGVTLPSDTKKYKLNELYAIDSTYSSDYAVNELDAYGNVTGVYRFSGWDQSAGTISGDVQVKGSWSYTRNQVPRYNVIYDLGDLAGVEVYDAENASYPLAAPVSITDLVKGAPYTIDTAMPGNVTVYTRDAYGNLNASYTLTAWEDPGNGTMQEADVTVTAQWTKTDIAVATHTVTYLVDGEVYGAVETYVPGQPIAPLRSAPEAAAGYSFSGWNPTELPAVMPDRDLVVEGTFRANTYTLTIHYVNTAGGTVAPDYVGSYAFGAQYRVASPTVAGYRPGYAAIRSDENGMPAQNLEFTIVYTPDSTTPDNGTTPDGGTTPDNGTTPDSTPTPDNGGSDNNGGTDTANADTGNAEADNIEIPAASADNGTAAAQASQPAAESAARTETENPAPPAENTAPEAVVTPDGNGGYELTPIADNETPLANLNLGDHHCCILHFLLMDLAFLVLCFYTRSRKKHQKKIFELREELELEKKRRGLTDTEDAGEERK